MADVRPDTTSTRRELLKKAGYLAPAVLTLKAVPAFASYGSGPGGSGASGGSES